jgi:hypothetical protein
LGETEVLELGEEGKWFTDLGEITGLKEEPRTCDVGTFKEGATAAVYALAAFRLHKSRQ